MRVPERPFLTFCSMRGFQAPQSWTMPELAAEVIDAQGSISHASEILQDLLTHQVNSFYFDHTVELIRLIMG